MRRSLGAEAALRTIETSSAEAAEGLRLMGWPWSKRATRPALACRQYDALDPDNQLVAAEPEGRWNDWLPSVRRLEDRLAASAARSVAELTPDERARFLALGADLGQAWNHADATPETRKRILHLVLSEAVVKGISLLADLGLSLWLRRLNILFAESKRGVDIKLLIQRSHYQFCAPSPPGNCINIWTRRSP